MCACEIVHVVSFIVGIRNKPSHMLSIDSFRYMPVVLYCNPAADSDGRLGGKHFRRLRRVPDTFAIGPEKRSGLSRSIVSVEQSNKWQYCYKKGNEESANLVA